MIEKALQERILQRQPVLAQACEFVRNLFFEVLHEYSVAPCDRDASDLDEAMLLELADDLAYMMAWPLDPRVWGFEFEPTEEQFCEGCAMMLETISLFIPKPGTGQPLEHYPGSLIPRLRKRDDPEFGRTVVVLEDDAAN